MKPEILRRAEHTEQTVTEYAGREFVWGEVDCGIVCARHVQRFGHPHVLNRLGKWSSPAQAWRAIRRASGGGNLRDLVGTLGFEEIPVSYAVLGDLLGMPADDDWGVSLGIDCGNGRALGFVRMPDNQQDYCIVGNQAAAITAWRVPCLL